MSSKDLRIASSALAGMLRDVIHIVKTANPNNLDQVLMSAVRINQAKLFEEYRSGTGKDVSALPRTEQLAELRKWDSVRATAMAKLQRMEQRMKELGGRVSLTTISDALQGLVGEDGHNVQQEFESFLLDYRERERERLAELARTPLSPPSPERSDHESDFETASDGESGDDLVPEDSVDVDERTVEDAQVAQDMENGQAPPDVPFRALPTPPTPPRPASSVPTQAAHGTNIPQFDWGNRQSPFESAPDRPGYYRHQTARDNPDIEGVVVYGGPSRIPGGAPFDIVHQQTNFAQKGHKKYIPELHPLQQEQDNKLLEPHPTAFSHATVNAAEKYVENFDRDQQAPLRTGLMAAVGQKRLQQIESSIRDQYAEGFRTWLRANCTLPDNSAAVVDEKYELLLARALNKQKKCGLDPKRANFQRLPGVTDYIDSFVDQQARFEKLLIKLMLEGPKTLDEAHIYYKYIVTGSVATQDEISYLASNLPA